MSNGESSGAAGKERSTTTAARELTERLRRINRAGIQPADLPPSEEIEPVVRQIAPDAELVEEFARAAQRAGCLVHRCNAHNCAALILDILTARAIRTLWLGPDARAAPFAAEVSRNSPDNAEVFSAIAMAATEFGIAVTSESDDERMFSVDAALTSVQAAVAESGSIIWESGPRTPRGATLIPPVHLALVRPSQILPDLYDCFASLGGRDNLPANVNLITGPSKTGDVEGVLVTGVHGPGVVEIIICDE